ncbi:MAG: hypothetical protein FWF05_07195 [Oscillospiraceae bacterium]|nr:hypothetical protein [Oscillospiraceae bacterium]
MNHNKSLKIIESVFLSLAALGIYNGIIQFAVYPALNLAMGPESFGAVLTLLSVMAVAPGSAGVGVNYARMAISPKYSSSNGDYNAYLLICAVVCALISTAALFLMKSADAWALILFPAVTVAAMLRYYSDVEFRLHLNYRRYFVFYMLLSLGSLAGLTLFKLTGRWELTILLGESTALTYVFIKGSIFRRPFFRRSENARAVFGSCTSLVLAQLLSTFILNADRMLVNAFMGGAAVTVFYVASLLGKATALLTGPLNGVIVGYLARYEKPVTRKLFALCAAGSLAAGLLLLLVFIPLSRFAVGLLYPDILSGASPYFLLANGGQILYFISNMMLVVALRFMRERIQLYINAGYAALYFALCIPALASGSMAAFVTAVITANAVRLAAVIVIGTVSAKTRAC